MWYNYICLTKWKSVRTQIVRQISVLNKAGQQLAGGELDGSSIRHMSNKMFLKMRPAMWLVKIYEIQNCTDQYYLTREISFCAWSCSCWVLTFKIVTLPYGAQFIWKASWYWIVSDQWKYWRKYLCVPATSTQAERVFSALGLLLTKRRLSMTGDNVNIQMFLKDNLEL